MRDSLRPLLSLVLVLPFVSLGCGDAATPTAAAAGSPDGTVSADHGRSVTPASALHFRAHLNGEGEVPSVDTRAQGQATLRLSEDGSELSYRLIVANLKDLHMAHIHVGAIDGTGPVVAWLYPTDGPPPQQIEGRFSGVLATGVVTAANLTGPLTGGSMADLVALMRAGETYVNVHTIANPGGEIRGQIE